MAAITVDLWDDADVSRGRTIPVDYRRRSPEETRVMVLRMDMETGNREAV